MSSSRKKNSSNFVKNLKNYILPFFFIAAIGFFISEPLRAQMASLYNKSTDEVAGVNALMSAVMSNDASGVRFFSKGGKTLVNQKNYGGATALHLAAREKNLEIVQILINAGAEVNVADNEGWTPLMRASLAGSKEITALLLDKGATANDVNSIGESAIIHATRSDCNDCLRLMFEKFNFIKMMNLKLLKDQLGEAFTISRNRANEVSQAMIESYLDRVVKMTPLIEKEISDAKASEEAAKASETFRVMQEDELSPVPMIVQGKDKREIIREHNGKRFRFVAGDEDGAAMPQSRSESVSGAQKFRFVPGQGSNNETVILTEKKGALEKRKPEMIITKSGNSIFVFTPGPEGKKLKAKPKPKPVAQIEIKPIDPKVAGKVEVKVEQKANEQKVTVTQKTTPAAKSAAAPAPTVAVVPPTSTAPAVKPVVPAPAAPATTVTVTPATASTVQAKTSPTAPATKPVAVPAGSPVTVQVPVAAPAPAKAPAAPAPAAPADLSKTILIDLSKQP